MPTISTTSGTSTGDGISYWSLKPRRLTPAFWRLFTLLYRNRGDVVDNDRICAELYGEVDQPLPANAAREHVRRLRRALAGGTRSSTIRLSDMS